MNLRFDHFPQLFLFVLFFTISSHTFAYGDNIPVKKNGEKEYAKTTAAREKVRAVLKNIFNPAHQKTEAQPNSSKLLLSKNKKTNRKNKLFKGVFSKRNNNFETQGNVQETDPT